MNDNFDYAQSAELYLGASNQRLNTPRYLRFSSAADAIQYAVEKMPRTLLRASALEVYDLRFEGRAILDLYMAPAYPLPRTTL